MKKVTTTWKKAFRRPTKKASGVHKKIITRVDRWSNEHCFDYWKLLLIAMFSWGIVFLPNFIHIFGIGHSAHAYQIWAWSDKKWMRSLQKTVNFSENFFMKIFWPQNPFLKTYMFGQGYSAHAYKIWAGSDEKWMSSSQKRSFLQKNNF